MKLLHYPVLALLILSGAQAFAGEVCKKPSLSKEKAQEVALNAVPGELLGWCLEIHNGVPTYTFDIRQKDLRINEVEVDGVTGKWSEIGFEIERGKAGGIQKTGNAGDLSRLKETRLSLDEARTMALTRVPGVVEYWELDFEGGKLVYAFMISARTGKKVVGVDAKNGTFTETTIFVEGNDL
jgi:uncharacterized membrane protein YkoI